LRRAPLHTFSASHCNLNGSGPGEKNNKSERVSGIVQGAGPHVEAGRMRPAGRSLGTTEVQRLLSRNVVQDVDGALESLICH